MKNILLTFVLLLTVSFAFAGNEVEKKYTFNFQKNIEITNSINLTGNIIKTEAVTFRCCTASSEGISVTICGGGNECARAGKMRDQLE